MATIAYSDEQERAINLDNVDSLRKENGDGFQVVFERTLPIGNSAGPVVIDRWRFATEKQRDRAFKSIIQNYGLPHG